MIIYASINNILDYFKGNSLLNAASFVLAILGLVFTIYFYYKSKKSRTPTYIVRTINLVREKIQKIDTVSILYSGEKVKNLSISKIALWNEGKETINSEDIALNNSIKIKIKDDFEFLDSEIIYQKNTANDFKIQTSDDNKSISIHFDYFDFEEGLVMQVFHTGNTSDDIFIDGKIKSVKRITRKVHTSSFLPTTLLKWLTVGNDAISKKSMKVIMGWAFLIVGGVFCLLIITPFDQVVTEVAKAPKKKPITLTIAAIFPGLLYIWLGYRMLKRRIPKGFDVFNEEF
jgi:hypothetical protein